MKKYGRNVNLCAFLLVSCCFLLLGGCMNAATQEHYASSAPAVKMDTLNVNDISGVWYCKLETGSNVEISLNGNKYNIKVDGNDSNRGIFSLQKVNNYNYIVFDIHEKFDAKIDWKRLHARYRIEAGNLILEGTTYKGTYTKRSI